MPRHTDVSEVAIACTTEMVSIMLDDRKLTDAIREHYAPAGYRVAEVLMAIVEAEKAVRAGEAERAYAILSKAGALAATAYDGLAEADACYGEAVIEFARRTGRKRRINHLLSAGIPFTQAEDLVA
jgi:hypothetical protein